MENILSQGFLLSEAGRRGKAVYFWFNDAYAVRVGHAWYIGALKRKNDNPYLNDSDLRCAMIKAYIKCAELHYFDLDSLEFRSAITQIVDSQGLCREQANDNIRLTELYELVIRSLEAQSGREFHVLKSSLPLVNQGKYDWYPFGAIGNPVALMVRELSIIDGLEGSIYEEDADGSEIS